MDICKTFSGVESPILIERLLDTVEARMKHADWWLKLCYDRLGRGIPMGTNSLKEDREKLMQETRESRLLLWELVRLRHPQWKLTERLIAADEISEELKQAFSGHPKSRRITFEKWQRMRLWPPPEILHDRQEQALERPND